MNKTIISAVIAASAFSSLSAMAATDSAGGTLTFTGQVTDTTCTINGGNSANMTIALDPVSMTDVAATGIAQKNRKQFTLEFANCTSASMGQTGADGKKNTLSLILTSDSISNDGLYLNNTLLKADGTKKNVGIALSTLAASDTPLNLRTGIDTAVEGDATTVDLYASYYHVGAAAADTGAVNTMVTYTVAYL